jgi:hypothetical protein
MKKNYIYLIVLVLIIAVTLFILPKSMMAYNPRLSIVIPIIISMLAFGGFITSTPEIKQHLVSIDDTGKENDNKYIYLMIGFIFIFGFIYYSNQQKSETIEFKNNGILTQAIVLDGEQKTKIKKSGVSNEAKLHIAFKEKSGEERKQTLEIDDKDFEKYSIGQSIQIKYLPNDPSLIKLEE